MRTNVHAVTLFGLGWSLVFLSCAPVNGGEPAASGEEFVRVLVEAPRDLRQQLASLKTAIRERQCLTAAEQLYELRSCLEAGDYFLVDPEGAQSHGLRRELRQLGTTLSSEVREAFSERYGRMDSDRLAAAIATRNCAELESIARLAANTDAGFQAALLLGYVYLDQRQPLEAVGWLQRLAEDPAVRGRYEPQVSVLLALAWSQAGMPDLAQSVCYVCASTFQTLASAEVTRTSSCLPPRTLWW